MSDAADLPADAPALDACGFVRVPTEGGDPLWMTCDGCGKSDHFWIDGALIRCRCGARYGYAVRPDGERFGTDQLSFVPFKEGPMQLADLEWDPLRIGTMVVVVLGVLGAIGWWLLG